jgi:hypothetical protein
MKKGCYFFSPPLFLCLSLLLSFFLTFLGQIQEYTIKSHSFHLKIGSLLILGILFLIFFLGFWTLYSRIISRLFSIKYSNALFRDSLTYFPFLFLILSPLATIHYIASDDLLSRLKLFGIVILLAFVYLKLVDLYQLSRDKASSLKNLVNKLSSLSLKNKLVILFVLALIIYNLGSALMISEVQTFSGDEPHYLLISHSLLNDGDFDLSNNYSNRDYTKYLPSQVELSPHIAQRTKQRYSFHSPGISFLLLPFYALGSLFEQKFLIFIIRFGMSIFGAILGLQIYLYALQEWKKEKLALTLWFLFSFTSPVYFYSIHVYPEIIAALLSFTVFRLLRFSKSFSKLSLLIMGLLLSSFIWLHTVKYVFITVPLLIYALWILIKKHKIRWNLLYFLAFPLILNLFHLLFSYNLYNSLSPFSVSLTGPTPTSETVAHIKKFFTDIPLRYRWETLVGYFFDQRDGLLLYSPLYFFAFIGMVEMGRRKIRELFLILFLTAPYVLNLAFLTQRTAYAPQARTMVAVFWGMGIFIGYFLAYNAKKIFSYIFYIVSFLSILFVYLLLKYPLALKQPTTAGETERAGELFLLLSNLHFYLPNFLPSYLKIDNSRWLPNYFWIGILLLLVASYLIIKKHSFAPKFTLHLLISSVGILIFFIWIVFYPRTTLIYPKHTLFPSGEKITFYSLSGMTQMIQPGKFHLAVDNRHYFFYFTSWREIKTIQIDFGSLKGEYYIDIGLFDLKLFQGKTIKEIRSLEFLSPPLYRFKNRNLYRISIYLERKSDVNTLKHPYFFSILPSS